MKSTIKMIRAKTGLSQTKFAILLGVSVASLRRWEAGETNPSQLARTRIVELMSMSDTELMALANNVTAPKEDYDVAKYETHFSWNGVNYKAHLAPYVINGPSDQREFYQKLISMQEKASCSIDKTKYLKRISLLSDVDGIETSQFKMESPPKNAKSWSSDYGTHGFHRYVGRFPSHLIRALINAFGVTENDIILDPFCGSGTTLVEARMVGAKAIGVEISPLSAIMSRVKSKFPANGIQSSDIIKDISEFYSVKWNAFIEQHDIKDISYEEILNRRGNSIPVFPNIERWFSKEALLGTSIVVEYIMQQSGYLKDFLTIALSARMRSIGNVDVDVVRAEYRKEPRENVDVLKLVSKQIQKMAAGINNTIIACSDVLCNGDTIDVIQGSALEADIGENTISHIITSPPYGVESLSYLRTHLLSFRALEPILGVDPYNFGRGIIGSEYLDRDMPDVSKFCIGQASPTYNLYFSKLMHSLKNTNETKRILMMMQFFEDMHAVIDKFSHWIKNNGYVAFVIGNKRLGESIIPTDIIIKEIFEYFGFAQVDSIGHKLKTNNSNSQVPWQDRIIENEYILIFRKES